MSTEYHKIETLYERDPKTFKLLPELILKNRVYGAIKTWHWTEKIDGTNIRITYSPSMSWEAGDRQTVEPASMTIGGRTDAAQIHADLYKWITENITLPKLEATFPDADTSVVLYGEGYGAGIQKGGGDYSAQKRFILFDVRVGQWWLSQENVEDVAAKLDIDHVPYFGEMTLEEATEVVRNGFNSKVALYTTGIKREAEGLIGRPVETLFDKKGHRLIVKLKTRDFAK